MQGWMIDPSSSFFWQCAKFCIFYLYFFWHAMCVYTNICVYLLFPYSSHPILFMCCCASNLILLEFVNLFWITYPQTFTSHTDLGTINQQFPQNLSEYHPPIGVWIACLARPPPSLPIATPRLQPRRPHTTPTRGQTVWWLKWIWKLGLLGLAEVAMIPMMEE